MSDEETHKLASPGEWCQGCYKFFANQGMEPKRMVTVFYDDGRPMTTINKNIPLVVCPFCDGDLLLRLPKE